MLSRAIKLHTLILTAASVTLLIAPLAILGAFGIDAPSFAVLTITRLGAGVLGVLAAAVLPMPMLPRDARIGALRGMAVAYALLATLAMLQQIAIWSSLAGTVLTGVLALIAGGFGLLSAAEARTRSTTA
jgi:hypothetical protein